MNDHDQYWLAVIKYTAIVFCVVLISSIGSCKATQYQIRKGVEAGVNPVFIACAFDVGLNAPSALCGMALVK